MGYSQSELGRRFRNGKTSGKASNVEIVEYDDFTALVGYGWAVYGIRNKNTGKVIYFSDWYGYSQSTSKQLGTLGLTTVDNKIPASPQTRKRYNPDAFIIRSGSTWNDVLSSLVSDYDIPEELTV